MAPIRRDDASGTVEISQKVFNFGISILAAFVLAVGGVGYRLVVSSAVVAERVSHLEEFANKGPRNTASQGAERDRRLSTLERWRDLHVQWGREKAGRWDAEIEAHGRRIRQLEQIR